MDLKYDEKSGQVAIFLEYDEIIPILPVIETVAMQMRERGLHIPDIEKQMIDYVYTHRYAPAPLILGFDFYQLDFALNIVRELMEHERARGNDVTPLEGFIEHVQGAYAPNNIPLS